MDNDFETIVLAYVYLRKKDFRLALIFEILSYSHVKDTGSFLKIVLT